jgi:carbon storage regulator
MLVLSRKPGETVVIGDKITVSVVETKGRQVQIGVVAPPEIAIWREELRGLIGREQRNRPMQNVLSDR